MADEKRSGYREIKEIILGRLRDKTWPLGSILPNEVELAQEFGCARTTVNRAMQELAEEGILDRKRKAGTRVNASPVRQARFAIPSTSSEITATGATYRYSLVERAEQAGAEWLRARLGLKRHAQVLHLRCMHYADNAPFQFEERWIVLDTVPTARQQTFEAIGPNDWLIAEIPLTNGELTFSAERAGANMCEFLGVRPDDPVFQMERITWLAGEPVTLARMTFPTGYQMTSTM